LTRSSQNVRVAFNKRILHLRCICEGFPTFAIGHFALGYLTGKGSSKLLRIKANLPLLLAASVIPDVDLILRFLMHRGPTHSIITMTVLMIPFFVVYKKQSLPYYVALLSHSLIGDFLTGGVQLFWPLSNNWFGIFNIDVRSLANVSAELVLFVISLSLMLKLGDLRTLLKPGNRNLWLIIPFGAVLGPMIQLGRGMESSLPLLLLVPSLFYLVLFGYSIFIELNSRDRSRSSSPALVG
jgi:membrane-bound metal-dependent hydrolase YbcI (DUF457 family)